MSAPNKRARCDDAATRAFELLVSSASLPGFADVARQFIQCCPSSALAGFVDSHSKKSTSMAPSKWQRANHSWLRFVFRCLCMTDQLRAQESCKNWRMAGLSYGLFHLTVRGVQPLLLPSLDFVYVRFPKLDNLVSLDCIGSIVAGLAISHLAARKTHGHACAIGIERLSLTEGGLTAQVTAFASTLRVLVMGDINHEELEHLPGLTALEHLQFNLDSSIADEDLAPLSRLNQLKLKTLLLLSGHEPVDTLSPRGVAFLLHFQRLTTLALHATVACDPETIDFLSHCIALQHFEALCTDEQPVSLDAVQALSRCTSLRSFTLVGSASYDVLLALCAARFGGKHLNKLCIKGGLFGKGPSKAKANGFREHSKHIGVELLNVQRNRVSARLFSNQQLGSNVRVSFI